MVERNTDVCIVGAGPAGLTLATKLASTGRSVILVESGGSQPSLAIQSLNAGECEGVAYSGLKETRWRQVGGTSNTWNVYRRRRRGAKYVPLDPHDLRDWPISWNELSSLYPEAQAICGLGRFDYEAGRDPATSDRSFDVEPYGLVNAVYHFGEAARFQHDLPREILRSDLIDFWTDSTVVGLRRSGLTSGASEVRIARHQESVVVKANAVVLACGAIENARLLLLAGLRSNWIGRRFMEHARDFSMTLLPRDKGLMRRAGFYDLHREEARGFVIGRIGPSVEALTAHGLPNASISLIPRHKAWGRFARRARSLRRRVRGLSGLDPSGRYGWPRTQLGWHEFDGFRLVVNVEHQPSHENRVDLSDKSDRFGNPLPRLHLAWTDQDQRGLERLQALITHAFREAGVGEIHRAEGFVPDLNAHHHAGTTRMADTSAEGVVDTDSRVFGFDNLYIAGASVFPRAGYANPTLTIVALAIRLAEHLDQVLD